MTCIVARTAYAKAKQALHGRGNVAVWSSLVAWWKMSSKRSGGQDVSNCPNTTGNGLTDFDMPTPAAYKEYHPGGGSTGTIIFVSARTGSDNGDGSEAKPYQTLHKAQAMVRQLPGGAAARAGLVVNVMAGTYYLGAAGGTLLFTSQDSGTPGSPVTWQAYPSGADVTISGGAKLDCTWVATKAASGAAAYKCAVPSGTHFESLFVNGLRQVRARYPNGKCQPSAKQRVFFFSLSLSLAPVYLPSLPPCLPASCNSLHHLHLARVFVFAACNRMPLCMRLLLARISNPFPVHVLCSPQTRRPACPKRRLLHGCQAPCTVPQHGGRGSKQRQHSV